MEVNCNGHAPSPESRARPESQAQGTKQETEQRQEDQLNANQLESSDGSNSNHSNSTENHSVPDNKADYQTCNGTGPADPAPDSQQVEPISPDSVAIEKEEGEKEERKEEEMETEGEARRGEEEDNQNGEWENSLTCRMLRVGNVLPVCTIWQRHCLPTLEFSSTLNDCD